MATQRLVVCGLNINTDSDISDANTETFSEIKLEISSGGGMNQTMESSSVHDGRVTQPLTRNVREVRRQVRQEQESVQGYQDSESVRNNGTDCTLQMSGIKQELDYEAALSIKTETWETCDKQSLGYEMPCRATSNECSNSGSTSCECSKSGALETDRSGRNLLLIEKEQPVFYERDDKDTLALKTHIKSEFVKHDFYSKTSPEFVNHVFSELTPEHGQRTKNVTESGIGDVRCMAVAELSECMTSQRQNEVEGPANVKCCQLVATNVNVTQNCSSLALCNKKSVIGQTCDKKCIVQKHTCKFCNIDFSEIALLNKHYLEMHNRAFAKLILHKMIHTEEKLYKCGVCDRAFHHPCHVKKHRIVHTQERSYICEACGVRYSSYSELKLHKSVHKGEKPHKCDVCNRTFSYPYELKLHRGNHTGEQPYKCDVCDRAFSRPCLLKKHKRGHTQEKSDMCEVCGARYSSRFELRLHRSVHKGEKPHKCDICERAFCHLSVLNKHKKLHVGEKP